MMLMGQLTEERQALCTRSQPAQLQKKIISEYKKLHKLLYGILHTITVS